jgi:hypothetical protein
LGSDERSPSLTIGQHRADDLVPDLWFHVRELIEDDAIYIWTPKRIRIISAVEADHRSVDEVDP